MVSAMRVKVRAFSIVELLVVMAIVGVLAALGLAAVSKVLADANRADSTARLKAVGQAIFAYAGEHDQLLPGPLWPGQVMEYDASRDGRIVRDLAPYLAIEHRDAPYLVQRMIPQAYRRNPTSGRMADVRVYVMNASIILEGQTLTPFGTLITAPTGETVKTAEPLRLNRLDRLPANDRWMLSETDQKHPSVAVAPWRASTPALPVHDGFRAVLNFDGSASLESAR
jgi:prepilin-type N-terminal cleavage/methylation domain-containing protein